MSSDSQLNQAFKLSVRNQISSTEKDHYKNVFLKVLARFNERKKKQPTIVDLQNNQTEQQQHIAVIQQIKQTCLQIQKEGNEQESFGLVYEQKFESNEQQFFMNTEQDDGQNQEVFETRDKQQLQSQSFSSQIRRSKRIKEKQQKQSKLIKRNSKKKDEDDFFSYSQLSPFEAVKKCLVPNENSMKRRKIKNEYEYLVAFRQQGKTSSAWLKRADIVTINPEYLFKHYQLFIHAQQQ